MRVMITHMMMMTVVMINMIMMCMMMIIIMNSMMMSFLIMPFVFLCKLDRLRVGQEVTCYAGGAKQVARIVSITDAHDAHDHLLNANAHAHTDYDDAASDGDDVVGNAMAQSLSSSSSSCALECKLIFLHREEYVPRGSRVVLRDGRVLLAVGVVC